MISAEEARRRAALFVARIKAGEEPMPEPMAVTLANGPTVAGYAGGVLGRVPRSARGAGKLERATLLAAVEGRLGGFLFGAGRQRRRCPACGGDTLELKLTRYGPFVGCADFPALPAPNLVIDGALPHNSLKQHTYIAL